MSGASVDCDAGGNPTAIIGNFAAIYKLKGADRNWAVKCFLRGVPNQNKRYVEVQKHFAKNSTENTIAFEYLQEGILVGGRKLPIVKMDWIDGDTLDTFLLANKHNPGILAWLLEQFKILCQRLHKAKIAHGDLHHGNLIVGKNGLKLVDYDGAYVPALNGLQSSELGHHNYQHPKRVQSDFASYLDNFSAWVIYTSLQALSIDPSLWQTLAAGDECLLFRSSDFGNPLNSYAFSMLESHSSQEIRFSTRILRSLCNVAPHAVPPVGEPLANSKPLPPLRTSVSLPRWIPAQQPTREDNQEFRVFPNFRAFNDAVRIASMQFDDAELKSAMCLLEDTKVGANGRVYHFVSDDREIAVKCFSADSSQRQQRYSEIAKAQKGPAKRFMVDCEYIPRGIYVNSQWYPILKMPWVHGKTLGEMASGAVTEAVASYMAEQFLQLVCAFRTAGLAHGDLEFSNLIWEETQLELKVIDYDNMFVPALTRMGSLELGHPGFQSPRRSFGDYGPFVDNFSAWLIHFLLKNMPIRANLYEFADACIQEERQGSTSHTLLRNLQADHKEEGRQLGKLLHLMLERPLHHIPDIHPDESLDQLIGKQSKEVSSTHSGLAKRKIRPW